MLKVMHNFARSPIYIYIYIGIAIFLASLISLGLIFNSNINSAHAANSADIEASVNIKPSLTLNIPTNNITMTLDPSTHAFDEKDLTVSVGTNNRYGYQLMVNTLNNTNTLVNVADNTKTIDNLTTSVAPADFPANFWGIRKSTGTTSSGNYGQFTAPYLVSQSSVPVNNDTTTLGFGAKVDYTKPSGLYNLNLEFKALPYVTQYSMQDLGTNPTLAAEICTEEPTVVTDSRDGQTYTISKLKDGNCWMTQNLKLGKGMDTIQLTPEDSDVDINKTMSGRLSYPAVFPTDPSSQSTYDNWAYYCTPDPDDTGAIKNNYETCYYNWYTATAGYGTSSTAGDVNVGHSICPVGWRLPIAGENSGDYRKLIDQYGDGVSDVTVQPLGAFDNINGQYKPGFLLAGRYTYSDTGNYFGESGLYWSQTKSSSQPGVTYYFLTNTDIDKAETYRPTFKTHGYTMRCILK